MLQGFALGASRVQVGGVGSAEGPAQLCSIMLFVSVSIIRMIMTIMQIVPIIAVRKTKIVMILITTN